MKHRSFLQSLLSAAKRFLRALTADRNLRIDVVIALLVLIFAYAYDLDSAGYAVLALTICAVMAAELFNTSVERLSNAVTEEYNEKIGAAKDIAAAAVIITALGAAAVGAALFLLDTEKLIMAVLDIAFSPRALAAIAVTLVLGVIFVLKYKERNK